MDEVDETDETDEQTADCKEKDGNSRFAHDVDRAEVRFEEAVPEVTSAAVGNVEELSELYDFRRVLVG